MGEWGEWAEGENVPGLAKGRVGLSVSVSGLPPKQEGSSRAPPQEAGFLGPRAPFPHPGMGYKSPFPATSREEQEERSAWGPLGEKQVRDPTRV